MSGGSWDYIYSRFAQTADDLEREKSPLRRAFGKHLQKVAVAMKSIEWVDSGDYCDGDEIADIEAVLGDSAKPAQLSILIDDAKKLQSEMAKLIEQSEGLLI